MKPALLFLAHRIPYPPNKGDKIRSFHMLRHLARDYRILLGAFYDDPADAAHGPTLEALCEEVCLVPLSPRTARLRSLAGLWHGEALTLPYYRDPALADWVARCLAREPIGRVLVFSSAMAQYVLDADWSGVRRVVDFVDVDSDKWRQYAPTRAWPMNWVYRREARRLLAFERAVIAAVDAGIFVSRAEAELFRRLAPGQAQKIGFANNGVDVAHFSPDADLPNPYDGTGQAIVFVGAMDYWPNVDAVDWFARDILPLVRANQPLVRFFIVGSNPAPNVRALGRLPGVVVTGRVDDARPYVRHAAVAVAPLRIARGIQNKVLESMALGRPTVVTAAALEGIDAEPGRDLLLAGDAASFAKAVCGVLGGVVDGTALGRRARRCVVARYEWERSLEGVDSLLAGGWNGPGEAMHGG